MLHKLHITLLLTIILAACSSNSDSTSVEPSSNMVVGTVTIENIDEWPSENTIVFQMYEYSNSASPLVEIEIEKPSSGSTITIQAENIEKTTYQKVLLTEINSSTNESKILIDYGSMVVSSNTSTLANQTIKFTQSAGNTFSRIQTEIINTSCISCHSDSNPLGELSLSPATSYQNISNIKSIIDTSFVMIKPYSSSESYFYLTLIDSLGAPLMPPKPLQALSEQQIKLVKSWIDEGAENN